MKLIFKTYLLDLHSNNLFQPLFIHQLTFHKVSVAVAGGEEPRVRLRHHGRLEQQDGGADADQRGDGQVRQLGAAGHQLQRRPAGQVRGRRAHTEADEPDQQQGAGHLQQHAQGTIAVCNVMISLWLSTNHKLLPLYCECR